MTDCDRCDEPTETGYALNAVAAVDGWVCDACVKDTDPVIDP
jgi:hypothetical protein